MISERDEKIAELTAANQALSNTDTSSCTFIFIFIVTFPYSLSRTIRSLACVLFLLFFIQETDIFASSVIDVAVKPSSGDDVQDWIDSLPQ